MQDATQDEAFKSVSGLMLLLKMEFLFLSLFGALFLAREVFYGVSFERLREDEKNAYYFQAYFVQEAAFTRWWTAFLFLVGLFLSTSFFGWLPESFKAGFLAFVVAVLPSLAGKNIEKVKSRRHAPILLRAYFKEGSWEYLYARILTVLAVFFLALFFLDLVGVF